MHVPRRSLAALAAAALMTIGVATVGQTANAAPASSKGNVVALCSTPSKGKAQCFALRRTDTVQTDGVHPDLTPDGYGPGDLQSAYNLASDGGAGKTVAIVDAFDDPNAEADLATYRSQYGLPACATGNGCFSKVSQRGGTDYPVADSGWAGEISLDLDMVSAIAPLAHILLVEADDNSFDNLGASVDEAVSLGAGYVSNSYGSDYSTVPGSGEDPTETTVLDAYYNHPGVAVTVSTGDDGYGVSYPAASQYVTAVGGTSLVQDSSTRGWSESVWNDAYGAPGSGCSVYEPKPSWQTDSGCALRTEADVSADADPATGVAVYDTYGEGGWEVFGGTSASSPIIASVFADAGTPVAGTYPSSYLYAGPSGSLNDVTTGNDGTCSVAYLCTAAAGYDGPTGLGTPNGLAAFTTGPHGTISGTVKHGSTPIAGATVTAGTDAAITDATGHYSLSEPVGTYSVTASAFGYASQTVTGVNVTNGDTVTENFSLTAVPSATISGTVTDGSGHGWPLYAKITVDGVPGGPAFTNPYTGAYSLSLPTGSTYQLHVTPVYPGYQAAASSVVLGSDNVTKNVAVPVDAGTCTAPGYGFTDGFDQAFDGTTAPAGWTVQNNTSAGGWEFDDPHPRGNLTGGSGGFAIVDSDFLGLGNTEDTYLVSPTADLSAVTAPEVSFDTDYFDLDSTAQVDLSIDGGTTWSNIWDHSGSSLRGPAHVDIPLPQAAGKAAVAVRFHYAGTWDWWWQVDNVVLGTPGCGPVAGGLVAGTVLDTNTGTGLVGATVTSDSGSHATTVATPDDPNLSDGFYFLFSTTGSHHFTAAKSKYGSATDTATVAANAVTKALFSLKAGQITVTPSSISTTLDWNSSATVSVTVKNTGGATANVTIGEAPGGFTLLAKGGAPLQMVKGTYSPLSFHTSKPGAKGGSTQVATGPAAKPAASPADSPWSSITAYPTPIQDNGVAYIDGKVYSGYGYDGDEDTSTLWVYDPATTSWSELASAADTREGTPVFAAVNGKIYATGGWGSSGSPDGKLEIYDPTGNTWTTGTPDPAPLAGSGVAVLGSDIYIVGGCDAGACGKTTVQAYDTSDDTWSSLAPYPEPVSWESCGAIAGQIYCAGGTTDSDSIVHTYAYDPSSDTWSPRADIPADLWGSGYTVAEGLLLVSGGVVQNGAAITNEGFAYDPNADSWTAIANANNALYRGGSTCGFYKIGGNPGGFLVPPVANSEVLPGEIDCASTVDVPWLSETPTTLSLAAGHSVKVTVKLNAKVPEVRQPGTYTAGLALATDTPYKVTPIAVTMKVQPPRNWGKITGTLLSGGSTLAGATVQIYAPAGNHTLLTDTNGQYALWLDATKPIQVIVAKDGYQPVAKNVIIKAGKTTTLNFVVLTDPSPLG